MLVEVNCETDFVARTDEFRQFVKNIAMQIAASNPKYIKEKMCLKKLSIMKKKFLKHKLLTKET